MEKKRPTLKSIAAELGLDAGSVSHILNHSDDRYSSVTRDRVIAHARKVGYRSNVMARAMRTGKTGIVGALYRKEPGHPLVNESFYMRLIEGLESELLDQGYKILLCSISDTEIALSRVPDILTDGLVEGLVIIGTRARKWLTAVKKISPNLVLLDQDLPGFHCVIGDYFHCGRRAAEHLLACGHRSMGIITSTRTDPNFVRRVEGFKAAVEEHGGCPEVELFRGDPWGNGGGDVARELCSKGLEGITALFGVNDHLAIGALLEFKRHGFKIPDNLSIMGCDNNPESSMVTPELCTIQIPKRLMGQCAADKLVKVLAAPPQAPLPPETQFLECTLVHRASVADNRG